MATSTNGTNGAVPKSIQQLREERRLVQSQIELARLQRSQRLLESLWDEADWNRDADLFDRVRNADGIRWLPIGTSPKDRSKGQNWPLWTTEQELDRFRIQSRILCRVNSFARGLLKNLTNYCIGRGYQYTAATKEIGPGADPGRAGAQDDARVKQLVAQVQDFLDKFLKRNRWGRREREAFRRTWRDGECFLRLFFQDDGTTLVRFVEPEQVTNPSGVTEEDGWTFGIKHQMEDSVADVETIEAYYIVYGGIGTDQSGEEVDAKEIVHIKEPEEDSTVKRGMPAFCYDTADALIRASKLQRNLSIGAAIRAATAEVWKFATATQAQITSLVSDLAEEELTNEITGKTETFERIKPGTIRRIPAGQEPVQMPAATGAPEHIQAVQGDLRQSATAFCAPEYLASGDASNANFASTKEAGTPFTKGAETDQDHFTIAFLEVVHRAINHAVEEGALPEEVLTLVEIQAQPPVVITTNVLEVAQADQIAVLTGWKSNKTCAMERDLDWEKEQIANDEYAERRGPTAGMLPLPGDPATPDLPGSKQEVPTTPIEPPSQLAEPTASGKSSSDVRATVGGLQAISALQQAYYDGSVPREAAVANAKLLFGFSDQEAATLFPEIAPVKLTPEEPAVTEPEPEPDEVPTV